MSDDEQKPWEVLGSRELLDASPYLKVRAETVRLPDGRTVENFYQLDQPDFAKFWDVDAKRVEAAVQSIGKVQG